MALPLAVQLYTLRDDMATDFEGTIRKVADIGYAGVETAGMFGAGVKEAAALFSDLGLKVAGAHSPLPLGDKKNEVLDTMGTLGCKKVICPWMDPSRFASADAIKAACDDLNAASEVAQANGLTLLYHNHWFEYETVEGKPAYKYMLEYLSPSVGLEIDTYWVKVGGCDPAAVIEEIGGRAPLLHIKDGPAVNREDPMVAAGDGAMDWDGIFAAAAGSAAEWAIVELDRSATDMLQAVSRSYAYLTGKGFAHGR